MTTDGAADKWIAEYLRLFGDGQEITPDTVAETFRYCRNLLYSDYTPDTMKAELLLALDGLAERL